MAAQNRLSPIPHPPKKPLVGNMLSLDRHAPMNSLMELAKELGPIFWLDIGGHPIVFVSGFSLVDELCDETRFDKTVRGALRRVRPVGGDGLFTADTQAPNWAKAHNILMPPFGGRAMQTYHPMMVDIARQLILKWERLNADDEIDVVHDMTALTLDTIGLCGFDYRFNSFYREDYHPYIEALVRSLETAMVVRGLPLEDLFLRERYRTLDADVAFMNKMVDDIVRERRADAAAAMPKDLLTSMLTGVDKVTGTQLDDVNIRYQIHTFLIAGHETTSGLLSYAIYALLKHPDILKKAYEEVDRVLGPDALKEPSFAQVTQLTYLQQILKEALRVWSPIPAFSLTPYKNETIGGQYKLPKNVFVNVLVPALHQDKSVWGPRPDIFDPENFSREAENARPVNAWKPFGNGQRACIGRGFAMHEATLALGLILQRFKLVDHLRYQLVTKETLTVKPDGFKIKVRLREDSERTVQQQPVPVTALEPRKRAASVTRPDHNTPLLILYGSNLGTTEELAHRMAETAEVNGFDMKMAPLDDYVGALPTQGALVVFCASYNGAPPDNATKFVEWLKKDHPADMLRGVRYTVFGCGNRDWTATYQTIPRRLDERLAALGAERIFEHGEADAREDLQEQYDKWLSRLAPIAATAFGLDVNFDVDARTVPLYEIEAADAAIVNPVVAAASAKRATIAENRELQNRSGASPSERSTRHIEVTLPEGVSWRVGDHLSVVPRNDSALVATIARRFDLDAGSILKLRAAEGRRAQLPVDEPVSVEMLLGRYLEVQQVATRKQIEAMAAQTRCPATRPKLEALCADTPDGNALYRAEILGRRKSVADLLMEFPACELSFAAYLEMLPLLVPRYYSISSSPSADPTRCAITVGVVEGPARSGRGTYRGVCSNWLASRAPGDAIFAIVRETKAGFRLPEDSRVPLIMIGPGTGLAPFRGFLQERAARKANGAALGPAMLFFGCRHPDQDFIYGDELKAFAADGIADLHVAFSRADGRKTYVQDLLRAEGRRVLDLIEAGAIVYICGDGSRMEPDVKRALCDLWRERTGENETAATQWIDGLGRDNRYVLDVWAGN
jgi:cytochrome P450/NADPH-cytochrome P450 reductase